MTRFLVVLVAAFLTSACARTGSDSFRTRAAQDLRCPEGQVTVEHHWENKGGNKSAYKHARGCGREAHYNRECQREGCLWILAK